MIPVYNEAAHLSACLQAIARQTVTPDEVIVVDNNSTDGSYAVAESFAFVTLLREPRQGVVHARNRGFDMAHGDVIARIDADTLIAEDWVATLSMLFSNTTLAAVSGAVDYHDLPYRRLGAKLDLLFRNQIARGMRDEVFLYGANMAIRRSVWQAVRADTCNAQGMHEDFDLAIHTQDHGFRVAFDTRLKASVSLRRIDASFADFWPYARQNPRTYRLHGLRSQRHMYPAIALVLAFYWPLKLLHRGYNPQTGEFSWYQALSPSSNIRVNPALFVD